MLSACLIVRDSARTLRACLESVAPWVDEIVVVDTGSKDSTVAIAEAFKASIGFFEWCDDFAAARNVSLSLARGDWLFWIDSDDVISPENGEKLRQLASVSGDCAPMAYVMQVHCPVTSPDGELGFTVVDHVKLFRNLPELRFEGRIHEQIVPSIRRIGGDIAWTDVFVTHANSDQSKEGRQKKFERDLRILHMDLNERPDHPFVLFNLGMTYSEKSEYALAVEFLKQSLAVSPVGDSHVPKTWALLVANLMHLRKFEDANNASQQALLLFPLDSELLFRAAILAHHFGRLNEAVRLYRAALQKPSLRQFSSMDPGIRGVKARHNLALVYADMSRWDLAELQWRTALEEQPNYRAGWRGLTECLIRQRRLSSLTLELGRLEAFFPDDCEIGLLQIQLLEASGDIDQAVRIFERLRRAFPNRNDLAVVHSQFLHRHANAVALGVSVLATEVHETRRDVEPGICLCMIVRDSQRTLKACLDSISPWIDEIIVVDTGSVDETRSIAQQCGAKVFEFPWCDDFSAARNESLRHAQHEWILWMDSDDTIDATNGRKLRDLVTGVRDESVLGFVMQVHCPGPDENGQLNLTVVDHVKIIRNRLDLRFEGRIHEQILPSIQRAGGCVVWTDLHIVHSGCDHSIEGQAKKHARDLHLLNLEVQEQPEHPFTLFNLGMTYTDMGRHEEAAGLLQKCISLSQPSESHLRKAFALLVYDLKMLGQFEKALTVCEDGLAMFPEDPELRFRMGVICHHLGRFEDAVQFYRKALQPSNTVQFRSYDVGIQGFKARHNLAIALSAMGRLSEAEIQWRGLTNERPHDRSVCRALGECLVTQRKLETATSFVESIENDQLLKAEALMVRALICEAQGDFCRACEELEKAIAVNPEDREPLSRLCRLSALYKEPQQAELLIRRLLTIEPHDAQLLQALGSICLKMERYAEAIEACLSSLNLRPDSADTLVNLGYALAGSGMQDEAVRSWQEALSLSPHHSAALDALSPVKLRATDPTRSG